VCLRSNSTTHHTEGQRRRDPTIQTKNVSQDDSPESAIQHSIQMRQQAISAIATLFTSVYANQNRPFRRRSQP
jgi:hypothetical protein